MKQLSNNCSLYIFCDGGARGNPGPAAVGYFIKDSKGNILVQNGEKIGRATNNVAEYMGVIKSLQWILRNLSNIKYQISNIKYFLDSKLVVNQLNGLYKIKDGKLRNLIVKVRQLERELNIPIIYNHIPREKNKKADSLLNKALDKV